MNFVGTGTRVLTFLVDTPIVLLLTYAGYRGWNFYVFYYDYPYIPLFFFWAAVSFSYYFFFEGIFNRTPGKWMSLAKIVTAKGGKPSLGQILVRCLVRIAGIIVIDSMFLPFINRTLHDYISKTYIIEI